MGVGWQVPANPGRGPWAGAGVGAVGNGLDELGEAEVAGEGLRGDEAGVGQRGPRGGAVEAEPRQRCPMEVWGRSGGRESVLMP